MPWAAVVQESTHTLITGRAGREEGALEMQEKEAQERRAGLP